MTGVTNGIHIRKICSGVTYRLDLAGRVYCLRLVESAFSAEWFSLDRVIRKRFIIDNGLDHFANVRAQQPIDRDMHELRRVEIALRSTIALIRSS